MKEIPEDTDENFDLEYQIKMLTRVRDRYQGFLAKCLDCDCWYWSALIASCNRLIDALQEELEDNL